jgi:hypothetical protein
LFKQTSQLRSGLLRCRYRKHGEAEFALPCPKLASAVASEPVDGAADVGFPEGKLRLKTAAADDDIAGLRQFQ